MGMTLEADDRAAPRRSPGGWRKPTQPAVKPTALAMVAGEGFPCSQNYLVSPISHPPARYSSVIALHGLLLDVPSAAVSPMGSVLVAIISRQTRGFSCGTGSDLFTGNVKVMRQRPQTTHVGTVSKELTIPQEKRLKSNGCQGCPNFNQMLGRPRSATFRACRSKFSTKLSTDLVGSR